MNGSMAFGLAGRGTAFETLLEFQHGFYAARGVALLTKIPTPIGVGGRRTGGSHAGQWERAWPQRRSIADYLGVWSAAGGRALAVEAKESRSARWSLALLKDHQREYLQAFHRGGGVALVLLHWPHHGRTWVMTWPWFDNLIRRGIRSLRYDDGWWWVVVDGRGGPCDYLASIGVQSGAQAQ